MSAPAPLKTAAQLVNERGLPVKSRPQSAVQWGDPNRFFTSASPGRGQIPRYTPVQDTRRLMTDADRLDMMGISNWLYWNTYIGGIIDDRATDCIGDAWDLQYLGENKAWGAKTEDWFYQHGKVCDVTGRLHWRDFLRLAVVETHRDGAGLRMLTETATGYPQQQPIPVHRLGRRWDNTSIGGIIVNSLGRPLAYRIATDDPTRADMWADYSATTDVPAHAIHHIFNPKHTDQYHGMPSLTRGGRTLQNQNDSEELQQVAFKMACAIGLLKRVGGTGNDENILDEGSGDDLTSLPLFKLAAGSMPVLPPGYDLESFTNNHPGERFIDFVNYLARIILLGMGIPYEYAFDPQTLTGPGMRFVMLKATKGIGEDQTLIERYAFRYYAYAMFKAAKLGLIPKPPRDWWNVTFSKPKQASIDLGRDASADQRDLVLGLKTVRQHNIERQVDPDAFEREQDAEIDRILQRATEKAARYNVPIETAIRLYRNIEIQLAPEPAPAAEQTPAKGKK